MLPRLALTFSLAALISTSAWAQAQPPAAAAAPPAQFDAPAYIATVEGTATLERDGRVETSPLNMPLLSGDKIRTTDGRVEVRFADRGRLLLDSGTSLDVLADDLVRLNDGRVRLSVVRAAASQVSYRVDSPAGSARIFQPGEYRVSLIHGPAASPGAAGEETQLEFAVISGGGEIATEQGTTPLRAGERAYASAGLLPSYAYPYNSAAGDNFDQWADVPRDTVYQATSPSAQYLPEDMTSYSSTFDQYGDWRYQQAYGYVWYPRVAAAWRPYYYGRWASYPSYGWTWIAADRFGYPTHHYGRWGFSAGLWFWIPSPSWGPAYVSWAYAPNYVSWCPLGYNNFAVFSIGYYNGGPAYYASHHHGFYNTAWTTVHHNFFGHGFSAHQHAVNFDHGFTGVRPHFTEGRTPAMPAFVSAGVAAAAPVRYAGTRSTANQRAPVAGFTATTRPAYAPSPGTRAITTPRYVNRGNEIVRSQTAQPIAPRDPAVSRTMPSQAAAERRPVRAWDNPSYRPPNNLPDAPWRVSQPDTPSRAPSSGGPWYGAPQMRGYERTQPLPQSPPQMPMAPQSRPQMQMPMPPQARPMPPQAPAEPRPENTRPGGGYARPAPPASGGEHAAPRPSGGGHTETHAPSGAAVAHSRGRG